jgi:diguanylate cyclase (GGDEF)-like protein/PAS domain S-box-containing protein
MASRSDADKVDFGWAALSGLLNDDAGDLTTVTSDGVLLYVSPVSKPMLGYEPSEMVGRAVDDFVHVEDLAAAQMGRSLALRSPRAAVAAYRLRCHDGGYLWTESVTRQVRDPRRGRGVLLVASVRDIADRRLVEVRLEHQALTDPLTGIANRTVLMDRLTQGLRRLERDASVLAVIYLDLDHFKIVNDTLGHATGDRLLAKVAERSVGLLRSTDTLARLGGDEFVVLAEGLSNRGEALDLAARICSSIEQPFDLEGESIVCTVSAGVSTTTDGGCSPQGLLQEADLALYRAKDRGRNRAEVFDEQLRTTALGRLGIERMVRSAISEGRLAVCYQPVVDLSSGHIVSVEALVRLREPDGMVLPGVFLSVAEQAGLLVAIDDWVLVQAVEQATAWEAELAGTDFRGIAVNITGRHLANSYFAEALADSLASNELPEGALSIDLTERVLMEATNSAMDSVRTIRAIGIDVGLDDFGTGYSSLAYLRRFPLDFLKLDGSVVRQLAEPDCLAIVDAIIRLAHALSLTVVAEGVETEEELGILTRLGCDRAQGFLLGAPDDARSITGLIKQRAGLVSH